MLPWTGFVGLTSLAAYRPTWARDFQDGYNDIHSLVLRWTIILGWENFTPHSHPFATLIRWRFKTRGTSSSYFTGNSKNIIRVIKVKKETNSWKTPLASNCIGLAALCFYFLILMCAPMWARTRTLGAYAPSVHQYNHTRISTIIHVCTGVRACVTKLNFFEHVTPTLRQKINKLRSMKHNSWGRVTRFLKQNWGVWCGLCNKITTLRRVWTTLCSKSEACDALYVTKLQLLGLHCTWLNYNFSDMWHALCGKIEVHNALYVTKIQLFACGR